jgi:hypothetical protein
MADDRTGSVGHAAGGSASAGGRRSPPDTLDVTLPFDASRYADAASPEPAQQSALADMLTVARADYDLRQVRADGTPDVTISIASSSTPARRTLRHNG